MTTWPEGMEPQARFDDCRSDPPRSFRLARPVAVVEARTPDEVKGMLSSVARSVEQGLWAAGFVAYEAALGLDPSFVVRRGPDADIRSGPAGGPPYAWFGLFEGAQETAPLDAGPEPRSTYRLGQWTPTVERAAYERDVERIRELIAEGQTYQTNYTFRLRSRFTGDAFALYRDLCLAQRAAHCAYLSTGRLRILSASPELFFRIDPGSDGPQDIITSRPMKGTARRGRWSEEDRLQAAALAASAKERAENAMIVDLIRNDLGRISVPGSVTVPKLFETERYETVWQLTSTVTSRIPAETDLLDVFRALFPCGSITGAPKIRTMQAIAALEDSPRGVYTGAIGWVAPPGAAAAIAPAGPAPRASFNVAIRTVVVDDATGAAEYGVGGGITWDSSPAGEYDECRAKALVLTARRPEMELLETLRFDPRQGFVLLDRHLDRLRGSAAYFGFAFDEGTVRRELEASAAGASGTLRVRLTMARDGTVRVKAEPLGPGPSGPVRVAVHGEAVDSADVYLFHKTTLRERYERARAAHPEAEDVLLVNERGEVTESALANVAARIGGRWWTPPLECGLLPGAYRTELVAAGKLGERVLSVDELRRADHLALVSSVRLWRRAVLA